MCEIVHDTCSAIVTRLMDTYIRFPTGDQLDRVVDGFLTKWGVPNCVGAIDESHIPIAAPINNHTDLRATTPWFFKGWLTPIIAFWTCT